MFEEAADASAPAIAGGRGVLTGGFDVIEDGRDCVGIQMVGNTTTRRGGDRLEQRLRRIPLGATLCALAARQILRRRTARQGKTVLAARLCSSRPADVRAAGDRAR
jgi:hypothetical protein